MNDYETILQRMRSRLTLPASTAEGSFVGDILGAVANELARVYSMELEPLLEEAFIDTATGDALTRLAENHGITRIAASKATADVTISGAAGADYSGARVTADGLIYELASGSIPQAGSATVAASALEAGSDYNVPAGAIDALAESVPGITFVSATAASGGVDGEDDETLRARTLLRLRTPSSSGNEADYLSWALATPGVMRAKVTASPPNVSVRIVAEGNDTASATLIAAVTARITALRPVGASVTVGSGTKKAINVAATLSYGSSDAAAVKGLIENRLQAYLAELSFVSNTVSFHRIAELLFAEGVADVASYTLNGSAASVSLGANEFPVLGTLTLTAAP